MIDGLVFGQECFEWSRFEQSKAYIMVFWCEALKAPVAKTVFCKLSPGHRLASRRHHIRFPPCLPLRTYRCYIGPVVEFEEAKKEAEKEGAESKNMEAVNMEISSRFSEIFQEIENATDATLAGYMDGFSSRQIKWYISSHGDEVKEIWDAIQRRLESNSEREQNEFFDQQGADRNLRNQWTATSALFDETKRSVTRHSGQSSSYSSFVGSLITLSLGYDGRSLMS